jgi:hypothetical protein
VASRSRPLNRIRYGGVNLVVDAYGDTRWSDEVVRGRWGTQTGQWVHPDDLDEPGRRDIPVRPRPSSAVSPVTGPQKQSWRVRDEDGNDV